MDAGEAGGALLSGVMVYWVSGAVGLMWQLDWCMCGAGVNGVILAGELVSEHNLRKSPNLVRGVEGVGEYMRSVEDTSSVQQLQLEPGLNRGSMSSLVPASKHGLSMGEPALPLTLNFSPKPQRAVVSSCRTSTGVLSNHGIMRSCDLQPDETSVK